jgi:hypothetical protein
MKVSDTALWVIHKGKLLDDKKKAKIEKWVDAFMQAAMLRLGGWSGSIDIIGFDLKTGADNIFPFKMEKDAILLWIFGIAKQILVEHHGEHLPLSELSKCWKGDANADWNDLLLEIEDNLEPDNSLFGYKCYVEDWELCEPRDIFKDDPAGFGSLIQSRYSWLLQAIHGTGDNADGEDGE